MQLVIEADVAPAVRMVDDIADRVDQEHTLLQILGDELTEYEAEVFATSGHGAWAPLDPATIAYKGSGQVLVDTGSLLEQLTSSSSVRVDGESVSVQGTDYAGYLKRGARGMPQRDPAPAPRGGEPDRWAHQLLDFVVHGR